MSQSGMIVAALVAGFVVYLAINGRLNTYWSLLTGGGATTASTSGTGLPPGAAATVAAGGTVTGTTAVQSSSPNYLIPPIPNPFGSGNIFPGVTTGL